VIDASLVARTIRVYCTLWVATLAKWTASEFGQTLANGIITCCATHRIQSTWGWVAWVLGLRWWFVFAQFKSVAAHSCRTGTRRRMVDDRADGVASANTSIGARVNALVAQAG
jgi:hypothetical protein